MGFQGILKFRTGRDIGIVITVVFRYLAFDVLSSLPRLRDTTGSTISG